MKTILITGASGFLGQSLCDHYVKLGYKVVGVSRNNKNLFNVKLKNSQVELYPCDVSNMNELEKVFMTHKPNYVIHAAATKFVDWAEKFPSECFTNNLIGSKNVLDLCLKYSVEKLIGISTDKASPPIKNLYGLTKATMEKLYTLSSCETTKICCVRYGNVTWSSGSVLPIWEDLVKNGKRPAITNKDMTRFFFSVDEAVNLIKTALDNIEEVEGKILSCKMKSCTIEELLNGFCEIYNCDYESIPVRPGERMYENLISDSEYEYTEVYKNVFLLLHLNEKNTLENHLESEYNTQNCDKLSHHEIKSLILNKKS